MEVSLQEKYDSLGKMLNLFISLEQTWLYLKLQTNHRLSVTSAWNVSVCFGFKKHFITSHSYLQSNDTLTGLDLLIVEMSSLFVCIFHPDVNLWVHTFGLSLTEKTCWSKDWRDIRFHMTIENLFLGRQWPSVLCLHSPCWPVRAVWSGLESCSHFQTGHWPQRCHWALGQRPG